MLLIELYLPNRQLAPVWHSKSSLLFWSQTDLEKILDLLGELVPHPVMCHPADASRSERRQTTVK